MVVECKGDVPAVERPVAVRFEWLAYLARHAMPTRQAPRALKSTAGGIQSHGGCKGKENGNKVL